jgi:flagellar protein FlaG
MATEIRPVSESSSVHKLNVDRERYDQGKLPKSERILLNDSLTSDEIQELIGELNDVMKIMNTKISFSIDTETNRPIIQVLDKETGELIRQIPPEELMRVSQRMSDVLGVLFDDRI